MSTFFQHNLAKIGTGAIQGKEWFLKQNVWVKILIIIALAMLLFGVVKVFGEKKDDNSVTPLDRKVEVKSISELTNSGTDLPLIGTVTSVSEATIRAESSGKLTRVYKKLGDYVPAGGIIAQFENSAEQAAVLQAEGAYEQAKASRDITSLNSGQAGTSLSDAKSQAFNMLSSAYSTMDDAIRGKSDTAFIDPQFSTVKLSITVPDANLSSSLETKRKAIEMLLKNRESRNKTLSVASDLITELNTLQDENQTIKSYLDDLYSAYTKALPDESHSQTELDLEKASVQSARSAIATLISTIVTTRSTLSSSITASQVAGNGGTNANSGTLATANAQVKQAQGAYNAALSRLEKTIIRSPINGTLNSLTIHTGDYVTAFSQVAVVSNNGALEIVTMATEDDAKRIVVGSEASINGSIAGVVTRIAPAIDPTTNKVEVRIGIKDAKSQLVNGQAVQVMIKNSVDTTKTLSGPIVVPISALKLTPSGAIVFTVSSSSTLIAIPVKEGAILGDQIQVLSGLEGNEAIVTDARGLKDGMKVVVSTK